MINRIIHFSLNNRIIILVCTAVLLIWGTLTLVRTEVDIFPDLNAPTVTVMTECSGLAPEEVERLVTYPIETSLNGSNGVRRVRSTSSAGFSVVWVEFDWDTDIYIARQTVSEKLSSIAEQLPDGVGVPTLGPQSSILGEIMIIGLTADSTSSVTMSRLRTIADRIISPRLLSLRGVSQVSVIGGDVTEVQIQLDPMRMKTLGVTLEEAVEACRGINDNSPGGIIYDYGNEYMVKADVRTADISELRRTVIKADESSIIALEDIADVVEGPQLPRLGLASERAIPAVLVTVTKQPATGTLQLTEEIENTLAQLKHSLPEGVHVSTDIFRQSTFISTSITNLQMSLAEGALFVIIVLFFFLMNLRTTLISVVALPLSILLTVICLHLLGFTLNTMSLGGIAIAIGSLVDDAIVDVENVYRRLRLNRQLPAGERQPIIKVIFEASKEVRMPILNSSLIIIASFTPLFFLTGLEGRMLMPLGVSFVIALIGSTIVALTITPVLCYFLLGSDKAMRTLDKEPAVTRRMIGAYGAALTASLRRPRTWIATVSVAFVAAMALLFTLGRSFLPPFNEGSLTINVSTLPGISLEESDRIGRLAEEIIMATPEVTTVARKTGRAELDEHSLGANVSEIEAPYVLTDRTKAEMVRDLRKRLADIPGTNIEIGQPISHRIDAMLSGTEAQIAIKVFGDDLIKLHTLGTTITREIGEIPGVVDVKVEQQVGRPQIDIRPRRDMLMRYGIPMAKFSETVGTLLNGEVVSTVYREGAPYDVTLRVSDDWRNHIDRLGDLTIESPVAGTIPLGTVAEIVSTDGPNSISRENVSRRLVISANVDNRDLRTTVNDIKAVIDSEVTLPDGYYVTYGGQFESEEVASRTLLLASLAALLVILLLLYTEFHNLTQSLIILVNMPLAMIGGVFILKLTYNELNIPAIIGFISLLGISTRNGMLLISRYNHLRDEGVGLAERIIRGSSDRLTPIIMTSLTSALALIPLALRGNEPGNEIQSPLAMVILGGLLTSTILNIFLVPILYKLTNENKQ
ncbi:MAG: CusA/CzcA family heavy metal efflux RND transporter [Paramuribaculum sp.]|nr:CusA/CzcA family heavy metal efflux RND transporter [Paramuribaculum sp.]